jgi:hypothetical protein
MASLGGKLLLEGEKFRPLRLIGAGFLLALALGSMLDELGDPVEGANGNAAALAVLLELAAYFSQNPPQNTEVTLVFLGSGAAGNIGLEKFLEHHADRLRDAYFVQLEHVGAGDLCWITDQALDPFICTQPHQAALHLIEKTAAQNPHLGVMGRSALSFDGLPNLRQQGLKGITLMGIDRLSGQPANRYRNTDTADQIDPATLVQTQDFLRAVVAGLD